MAIDLGTRLVREALVSRSDLERALSLAARTRRPLANALLEMGLVTEDALVRFFRARLPFGEVDRGVLAQVAPEIATTIPREMAEEFGMLAIGRAGTMLSVGMVDPSNSHAIDEVAFFTGCTVVPLVARASDLDWARERLYPPLKDTAPLPVPVLDELEGGVDGDDAVVDLVRRRSSMPGPAAAGSRPDRADVTAVLELTRPKVPDAQDWSLPDGDRDTPVTGLDRWPAGDAPPPEALPVDEPDPQETTEVRSVVGSRTADAEAADAVADAIAPMITGVHEIGIVRRAPATIPMSPPGGLSAALARLHRSGDRDEVIGLAVDAVATVCRRAALFIIKKAVAQGWDARGDGVVPGAIRNVWIPIASPSVLRNAVTTLEPWIGAVEETIANGILMAALGQRADRVGVWPVVVRERAIAVLYADGFNAASFGPVDQVVHELAEAFERIILGEKGKR